jgi:hypothetical protein
MLSSYSAILDGDLLFMASFLIICCSASLGRAYLKAGCRCACGRSSKYGLSRVAGEVMGEAVSQVKTFFNSIGIVGGS